MHISLVVLKSSSLAALSRFYESVGIKMTLEKHGEGPAHYSGCLDHGVLEIYPAKQVTKTTFGIAVQSAPAFRAAWVAAGGRISKNGTMLIDPDGNSLFISEATPN